MRVLAFALKGYNDWAKHGPGASLKGSHVEMLVSLDGHFRCYRARVSPILLALIVGLVVCQVGIFCTTLYLHRSVAHRAVTYSPVVRFSFRLLIWLSTGIQPRQWAAVHRRHHAFTDVEGDPHSPLLLGFWKVQIENALLYRRTARDGTTVEKYAKDLQPDKLDKYVFSHGYFGPAIGIAILCVSLGWQYGLLAAGVHVVSYLMLNGAVNAVGHWKGKKSYVNTAFNVQWLAWLTGGEGLHNNHHAAPTSARLSHQHGERDPGWWVIHLLTALHGAKVRLDAPHLVSEVLAS